MKNRKRINTKESIIDAYKYQNSDVEAVGADAIFVRAGAFSNCESLEEVYFGLDITRISNGAFKDCKNLKHVWFAIIDEDKYIEISDDAFDGCPNDITFHIFATAIKNPYLNKYARKHGFRVEGMI